VAQPAGRYSHAMWTKVMCPQPTWISPISVAARRSYHRPQVQPAPEGAVRELITRRLGEMGLSMKDASLRIGRNETYLCQFLMRGSPAELGERERQKLAQLLGVLPDNLRGPGNPRLSRLNELCSHYERALRSIIANPTQGRRDRAVGAGHRQGIEAGRLVG